jgi:hypothetical protein
MPHRLKDENITTYSPTPEDLAFAEKFVRWNTLPYGIQRIDAIRCKDGELLLTEVEDWAQYLYLLDIDSDTRERALRAIFASIRGMFS